jgi:hypothetical protein
MRWRILLAVACVLFAMQAAWADPSIVAFPRPYAAGQHGGIRWEVFVTQNDPNYAGALSVELPLTLSPHNGPAFPQFMNDSGGDDTNGTTSTTWYYNETAAGSGVLLWNISNPPDP